MRRREFIKLAGGAAIGAIAATRRARSQTPKPLRVGMVHPVSSKGVPPSYVAFVGRLRELGYVEGDTLTIEYINLEGHPERYDEAMRELVRRRVDLIFALGQEDNLRAAMAATSTIPIVMMAIGYDPLTSGFVSSLARPDRKCHRHLRAISRSDEKAAATVQGCLSQSACGVRVLGLRRRRGLAGGGERRPFARHRARRHRASRPALRLRTRLAADRAGIPRRLFLPASAVFASDADRIAAFALRHRMVSCLDASPRFVDCRRTDVVWRRLRCGGTARGGIRRSDRARRQARGSASRSNRRGSPCGSISRPRKSSASPSRLPSSPPPTR